MLEHTKIGIAPLTWTNDDLAELGGDIPFEQCITEMAQAGFVGCEVGNKFPKNPETLKHALEPLGLCIANQWFSSYLCDPDKHKQNQADFDKQLIFLHAMGAKRIGVCEQTGSIQGKSNAILSSSKPIFADWQWHDFFLGLEIMADKAADYNIEICYHHHMGTGVQSFDELSILMNNTSQAIGLTFDTGHFVYADIDPLLILKSFGHRINHVHLKDVRQGVIEKVRKDKLSFLEGVKLGTFTVPGDGDIDFAPIFQALDTLNYKGWMIVEAEQDPSIAMPLPTAIIARDYLRQQIGH